MDNSFKAFEQQTTKSRSIQNVCPHTEILDVRIHFFACFFFLASSLTTSAMKKYAPQNRAAAVDIFSLHICLKVRYDIARRLDLVESIIEKKQ